MCLVHSKSSINGNHSHQSPVPLLILLDGNCSSLLINPKGLGLVSGQSSWVWAQKLTGRGPQGLPPNDPSSEQKQSQKEEVWRENHVYHHEAFKAGEFQLRGEGKLTYLTLEDYQILLSLVKGKFTPFEISKQSETSSEFLIFSNLKNDISKNEAQQTRKVQEKSMATCFCLWLDSQWGSGTYGPYL